MRLFSMQVKHWWEKLSKIMLEEGFYTKPEYVGYIIAFEHDFRDLLGKVHDLEAENRRLRAVAEKARKVTGNVIRCVVAMDDEPGLKERWRCVKEDDLRQLREALAALEEATP